LPSGTQTLPSIYLLTIIVILVYSVPYNVGPKTFLNNTKSPGNKVSRFSYMQQSTFLRYALILWDNGIERESIFVIENLVL
jgi:hypothetical protein